MVQRRVNFLIKFSVTTTSLCKTTRIKIWIKIYLSSKSASSSKETYRNKIKNFKLNSSNLNLLFWTRQIHFHLASQSKISNINRTHHYFRLNLRNSHPVESLAPKNNLNTMLINLQNIKLKLKTAFCPSFPLKKIKPMSS